MFDFAALCPYQPLTGTLAWAFLLCMELEELYVSGINFYNWSTKKSKHGTFLIKEIDFIDGLTKTSCNIKKMRLSKNICESGYITSYNNRKGTNQILTKNEH